MVFQVRKVQPYDVFSCITQVGHSSGGALAVLNTLSLAHCDNVSRVTTLTAGCPKIFDEDTAKSLLPICGQRTRPKKSDVYYTARTNFLNIASENVRMEFFVFFEFLCSLW